VIGKLRTDVVRKVHREVVMRRTQELPRRVIEANQALLDKAWAEIRQIPAIASSPRAKDGRAGPRRRHWFASRVGQRKLDDLKRMGDKATSFPARSHHRR